MIKTIDGFETKNGREVPDYTPNLIPVIRGFSRVLGDEKMTEYLHECFDEDASFAPAYFYINLDNGRIQAGLPEQAEFVNFVVGKLSVETVYEHKGYVGKRNLLVCN